MKMSSSSFCSRCLQRCYSTPFAFSNYHLLTYRRHVNSITTRQQLQRRPTTRLVTTSPLLSLSSPSPLPSQPSTTKTKSPPPPHEPVLLNQLLAHVPSDAPVRRILDCTLGAGGHAQALLHAHSDTLESYVGLDVDGDALKLARTRLCQFPMVDYRQMNFRDFRNSNDHFDFILLDAGVSSMQLDDGRRGFSFMRNGPLDMRLSTNPGVVAPSAATLVNTMSEQDLANVIQMYGEESYGMSKKIAHALVKARLNSISGLQTTEEMTNVILSVKPWKKSSSSSSNRKKRCHPATQTFQALRIAVNDELGALQTFIRNVTAIDDTNISENVTTRLLRPGGRIAVISFHSLEDRIVKQTFKEAEMQFGGLKIISKKCITPEPDEVGRNARARSAKMRVAEQMPQGSAGVKVSVNKYASR